MKQASTLRRSTRTRYFILALATAGLSPLGLPSAHAANGTWNAAPTNGMWEASGAENNWNTGVATFPGSTAGGTTNADIATFTGISNITNISINSTAPNSSPLTINGITFTGANKSAYTIGSTLGNALWLSSGGQIAISGAGSSGTGNTETVNSPLVLQPTNATSTGAYTITNNSTGTAAAGDVLIINGPVTAGTTTLAVTLTLRGGNTNTTNIVNGQITNGGATGGLGITKADGGVWTLSNANNTFTGPITIQNGTLRFTGGYTGGSNVSFSGSTAGTLLIATSGIVQVGDIHLDQANSLVNVTSGTLIAGSISENAASASRQVTLNGGILKLTADMGAITGPLNLNGGTLANGKSGGATLTIDSVNNNFSGNHVVNVQGGGGTFDTTVGSITSLAFLNGGGGTVNIIGGNTLKAGATVTSVISVQGASTWDTNGVVSSVGGLSGSGTVTNSGAAATLTSNVAAGTQTFSGTIAGGANMSFTKSGAGAQVLSGTQTYTGATSVTAGGLIVTGALTTSTITVSGGSLGGTGNGVSTGKLGDVILAAGGTIAPGASVADGSVGTLTINNLDANNGNTRFDLVSPAASDKIIAGAATFSGANTFTLVGIPSSGTYTLVQSTSPLAGVAPTLVTPTGTRATYTSHYADINPNEFQLTVAGTPKTLTWTGSSNNTWDVTGAVNWTDGVIPEQFFNLDTVTFNNSGANKNLGLNTTVTPAAVTFNNDTGNDYTLSGTGAIAGLASTLTKSGTGKLILATNNSFGGGTTISAGVLQVGSGGTSGSLGTGTVTNNAALVFNRSDSTTLSVAVNGTGSLQQSGAGTLVITSSNNYSGTTTIDTATTVQLGDGGATGNLGITSGVTDNGTLVYNRNNLYPLAAVISGSGSLAVNSGTLALSGSNTYSGTTTINVGGTLQIGAGGTTGSPGTGAITNNGTLAFNRSDVIAPASFSGGGAIQQNGTGTLVFSGASSFTGPLVVNTGTVAGLHANAFGSTPGITLAGAGTLSLRGDSNTTFARVIDNNPYSVFLTGSGATIDVDRATVAGTAPKIMTIGPITAAFAGPSYTLNFTGANSTGLSVGAINGPAATQGFATTVINNLNVSGTTTIDSYTGNNTVGNETVNFNSSGNTVVTNGINDPPSLWPLAVIKSGNGTLTLNGASTYSNGTTVTAGTVAIGNDNAFGTGPVNINAPDAIGVLQSTDSTTRTIPNDIINSNTNFYFGGTGNLVFTGAWNKGQFFKNLIVSCPTMTIQGVVSSNPGANQGFSKEGLGTLVLAGANVYTGDTVVRQGTLTVAPTGSLGDPTFGLEVSNNNTTGPGTNTVLNLSTVTDTTVGSLSGFISTPTSGTNSATINTGGSGLNLIVNQTTTTTAPANIAGAGNFVLNSSGTLNLSGNLTFTGTTTVNAGVLNVARSFRSSSALNVADGAKAAITPRSGVPDLASSRKTLQVGTLNLNTTGTLDMADNDLVVDNGSFTAIQAAVLAGFMTTGPGIITSTSDGSQIHALFDNALVGATDWNGGTISANAVVGKYTYFGDANIDGQVSGDDYGVIDANLNTTPPVGLGWLSGDMNLDGSVTGDDYGVIDANLGLGTSNPLSASALGSMPAGSLSAVPEPASLGVLAMSGAMLLGRRRRRS